jgi:peptidoglycan hydrolase-like protein with peptidoglycan-binding domain/Flp pilus assembly protein TadD
MTRLLKAWKGWAAVTVILRIAVEQARFGSQRRDNEGARFNATRSAVRPLRAIGVSVLVLACVPSTALAGQRTSLHAHHRTTRIEKKSGQQSHGTTAASRGTRVDPPRCRAAGHTSHANGELLALGSGYGTPGGSCSVRALQRRLAATGYVPGPIDGLYGPLTQGAVRRFQGAYGLLVDGIAGSLTLRALAARAPVIHPGAGYASDGSAPVRALQRHLARSGYRPGRVDGLYGPLTEQAVERFQTAHGLSADGVAGPRTLARLSKNAASHRRPSHHARRRPTRSAPASPKHHTRPTPATQKPAGQTRPRAEHRPNNGPGIGLILLIGFLIAALPVTLFEIRDHMHRRRGTTSPRPPAHDEQDTSPAPAALAATGVPLREGDTSDEAEPTCEDEPMDGVDLAPAVVSSLEENGARHEDNGVAAAFDRGDELAERGDFAGAEAAYRRAADGGHGDAASNLGVLLEQRGDLEGAEAAYRRADALGGAVGALNLGGLLAQQGDVAGAVAAYRRAAERGDASAAFDLGRLLLERGEAGSAEAAFRQAADGGDADAASNLGVLLEERGDESGAEAAYRQADEHGHAVAAFNLGGLLEERGDLSGAEEAYLRAWQRGDTDVASAARRALQELNDGPKSESPAR